MKLQSRLVIGFLTATCLTAAVASMVGITMINKSTLDEVQHRYISHVLKITGGRIGGPGGAAEILGMKRTTLQARMRKLGVTG